MYLNFILILVGWIICFSASWAIGYFGLSCFEQIIFHLQVPLEGTNTEFIFDWLRICFSKASFLTLLFWLPRYFMPSYASTFRTIAWSIFILCLFYGAKTVGLFGWIANLFRKTDLYEQEYVDGKDIEITFPKQKRNLIYLYVESLETTYTSKENGGNYHDDLIPEITKLAKENVNFSHTKQLGGAHVVAGTGWTTGGIVAQSAGVPLLTPLNQKRFSDDVPFLPGAYALGDILAKEGYNQEYLIGSNAYFGGRKFFFDQHGKFKIFDLNEAYAQHILDQDYHVFWGFEDEKLFSFAKYELLRLAKEDKPFHLSMLTVDTHHPKGYKDDLVEDVYEERLSNIIRGNSKKIGAFIDWLKQQDFYENTTIILCGDHTSMAAEYIDKTYDKNYDRTTMNVILNSQATTKHTKERLFTSFDMFPTTLAAMGVQIEGDKLGLGTNLFSDKSTIAEKIGLKKFDQELRTQSAYYKRKILK